MTIENQEDRSRRKLETRSSIGFMAQPLLSESIIPRAFRPLAIPPFKPFKSGQWELDKSPAEGGMVLSYFHLVAPMPEYNWYLRKDSKVWMSNTPMEVESQGYHSHLSWGHVVMAGLGMGVLLYNLLNNPRVTWVTVLEEDWDVLQIFKQLSKPWPSRLSKKFNIVPGSAFDYRPEHKTDVLLVDIWRTLGSDAAEPNTIQLQNRMKASRVGWWGQELAFINFLHDEGLKLPATVGHLRTYERYLGCKLMGSNFPAYPSLAEAAAFSVATAGSTASLE